MRGGTPSAEDSNTRSSLLSTRVYLLFFFFQAEDGIRDYKVTGVQTCALPILHGITTEFLKDKPRFEHKVDEIWEYLQGAELIIHNAPFDLGFLNKELELANRPPIRQCVSGVIDTLVMAKEMFPGKRNSLDSLCDRLEVDNSGRTLHGALLDAELLADVYINLTRGQEALLMAEEPVQSEGGLVVAQVDLASFKLRVVHANDQELAAHEDVMVQMDKSSGGKTIWRGFENRS